MVKPKEIMENLFCDEDKVNSGKNWRLKLDKNENIYGVSNFALSALKHVEEENISLYPNQEEFLHKLSLKYNVDKDNILLSDSTDEAIRIIASVYSDKDSEFLSYSSINSSTLNYIKLLNIKFKQIKYQDNFTFNKDKLIENISKNTKIVYISTPDIVSGYLTKPSMLELIVKSYTDTVFIFNCKYINFAQTSALEDFIDLVKKYDNVIILKSYSADYSLAGLKLCSIYADKSITSELKKVLLQNVNSLAIICASCQDKDKNRIDEIKEANGKNRELLYNGLKEIGFEPYKSEANFVLCNFFEYSDFYYQKFKNNGIITKKFDKDSEFHSCLRITVPKEGGVKYLFELTKKKDVLIFNPDRIFFDIEDSFFGAIKETVEILTGKKINTENLLQIKNLGGLDSDLDLIKQTISNLGYVKYGKEILEVYEKILFKVNDSGKKPYLDSTKLIIKKEILEELSKNYDIALFSSHTKKETEYVIKQLGIEDSISYISSDNNDLKEDIFQERYQSLFKILKHCPFKSIKLFGANVDDIISGNIAKIDTIGVIPSENKNNLMANNFKHLGAKHILNDTNFITTFLKELD